MDALYEDKLDGLITREQYEAKREEYEERINEIIQSKDKHSSANIDYLKLGMSIFELAQKGGEIYQKLAKQEEKKELLNFIFLNLQLKEEKVYFTPHNGFEVVALRAKDDNWLRDRDSNPGYLGQNQASCL